MTTWKQLHALMKQEGNKYMDCKDWDAPSTLTLAEVQGLLWHVREHKEMLRSFRRTERNIKNIQDAEMERKKDKIQRIYNELMRKK